MGPITRCKCSAFLFLRNGASICKKANCVRISTASCRPNQNNDKCHTSQRRSYICPHVAEYEDKCQRFWPLIGHKHLVSNRTLNGTGDFRPAGAKGKMKHGQFSRLGAPSQPPKGALLSLQRGALKIGWHKLRDITEKIREYLEEQALPKFSCLGNLSTKCV